MTVLYQTGSLSTAGDYWALLKPRVMSLVVFTGIVGMLLAPGRLHPLIAFTALLCLAVGAGAAGALNMWFDMDMDAKMSRTRGRPLPAGRIHPDDALGFGAFLSSASVVVMGLVVNVPAALLLSAAIFFYVAVYTFWLKRRTPQNIVIGGAAGALPPVIGWVAATGYMSLEPWVLFLIIFFWTPPHFWALALLRRTEYAEANVPMLPVVAGVLATKRHTFFYAVVLFLISLTPYGIGFLGNFYAVTAFSLGSIFLFLCGRLWQEAQLAYAPKVFGFSITYLFLLFLGVLVDHLIRT